MAHLYFVINLCSDNYNCSLAQVKNSVAKSNATLLSEYLAQSRQGLSLGRKQMPQNIACRQVCDLYAAIWMHSVWNV